MIRVFVGCSSGDDLESQAVLEYTLRKHCSQNVELTWMQLSKDHASPFFSDGSHGWQTQQWSTPFSGFRWLVPALCHYIGHAIYCDSDTIWMADAVDLWHQKFQAGKAVIAKGGADSWRFCVSMWDCAEAAKHILPAHELRRATAHQEMIGRFAGSRALQPFDGNWNCIDGEDYASLDDPDIKVIHYSDESCQPHLKYAVPRLASEGRKHWFDGKTRDHWRADVTELFDRLLSEAIAAGFKPENYKPTMPFGPYRLKSHTGYSSHRWSRHGH